MSTIRPMRTTLYSSRSQADDDINTCGVIVEVMFDPYELRQALRSGDHTIQEVVDTLARGVKQVSKLLAEIENEHRNGISGTQEAGPSVQG